MESSTIIPNIIIKANKLIIFIDCPVTNITARVADIAAGIPTATHIATLNRRNKKSIIRTNIRPPTPFLSNKLILSLISCDDKSYFCILIF